jgi:DNA-binding response OmpR family regulator
MDHISDARILVVEDQPADRHLIEQVLAAAGFRNVGLSSDPRAVATEIDPLRLDLVVLDLWMPGMDGFAVLRQLRERIPSDSYFPVLVITADVTVDTRRRALLAGATDFLTKPIDVVEVTLRVRQLLETRRLQVELANQRRQLEVTISELRRPLANVLDVARKLAGSISSLPSDEAESLIRLIAEEAGEAAAVINDLLARAPTDSNGVAGHNDPVTLRTRAL